MTNLDQYRNDPIAFAENVLGKRLTKYQKHLLSVMKDTEIPFFCRSNHGKKMLQIINQWRERDMTSMHDFCDGRGLVPAHRHKNPDGKEGGWVSDDSRVSKGSVVSECSRVYGASVVSVGSVIKNCSIVRGASGVHDGSMVTDHSVIEGGSAVTGESIVKQASTVTEHSIVGGHSIVKERSTVWGGSVVDRMSMIEGGSIVEAQKILAGRVVNSCLVAVEGTIEAEISSETFEKLKQGIESPSKCQNDPFPPPVVQPSMSILLEAQDLVTGDRQKTYGDPVENWDRTAKMFSAYLGIPISSRQASDLMILVKMSRLARGHHKDSYRDVAGYAWISDHVGERPIDQE